jgi:sigma-E factor negative regulatory protein RseA
MHTPAGSDAAHERLSALVDGELDRNDADRACDSWRDEAAARRSWHTYQLIGDVLRSDDLASTPERDSAFLAALRARLADEPVVLAPQAEPDAAVAPADVPLRAPAVANGRSGGWRVWRTPAAVVAGFAMVATALVATRLPGVDPSGAAVGGLAAAPGATPGVTLAATSAGSAPASRMALPAEGQIVLDGQLIRDARLDEYLAAHKKFGGSSGPGTPSGFLRNATATPGR